MKNKAQFLFVLVALSLIFASCKPQTDTTALSAALSELAGKVEVKQAGKDAFVPASADTPLQVNGQVQTGDDGRARLDLSSGTIVRVAPSSLFTLSSNDPVDGGLATKIKLDLGKIFIILSGGSADVETPSGVASVKGSYMKVEVDSVTHNVYVTCLEGDCGASNESGSVHFSQGQKTILFAQDPATGNWTAPIVGDMTPDDFQDWLDENPEVKDLFDQAMGTLTAIAQPTEVPSDTPTATATLDPSLPPADGSSSCFKILQPASGTEFTDNQGKVTFEWTSQAGAAKYEVEFSDSSGNSAILEATETSITKYIEILPNGGTYEWKVTAYKENGEKICSTHGASFTKPAADPTSAPEPTKVREPEPTEPPTEVPTEPPMQY